MQSLKKIYAWAQMQDPLSTVLLVSLPKKAGSGTTWLEARKTGLLALRPI